MTEPLDRYWKKRDFAATPEPKGSAAAAATTKGKPASKPALSFAVQKHAASRLHYDFRLELEGSLKSWAVPKGPSLDPADKRMAVNVEDHPLSYANFEGTIPPRQYGAGTVIVWDRGEWIPQGDGSVESAAKAYEEGKIKFELRGEKLRGHWMLVRMRGRGEKQEPWLLIKERDDEARPAAEYSVVDELPDSVINPPTAVSGKENKTTDTAASASKDAKPARKQAAGRPAGQAGKRQAKPAEESSAYPEGAVASDLPLILAPQLATLVDKVPPGNDWIYEIKFDGYRMLTRIDGDTVRLFTRNGHDWSSKMKGLVAAIAKLGLPSGWLDGEIVVQGDEGTPNFQLLQNAFDSSRTDSIQYFVFDLPYFDGQDLRRVPLAERRHLLRRVLQQAPASTRVHFSEDFQASADDMLHTACQLRLEGLIGKRKDAIYSSRRSPSWIKLKCNQRQEFVIGGYTDPKGSRSGLGSLLLGIHDLTGKLLYAGNVGTGFDEATLTDLTAALQTLRTERPAFADKPRDVKGNWVKPKLVAEVSFSEWTQEGRIRHAVFHGLRTDKPATSITREQAAHVSGSAIEPAADLASEPANPQPAKPAASVKSSAQASKPAAKTKAATDKVGGIKITHGERVIDKSTGITKFELASYYERASRLMLPHLVKRPVSLVRGPDGVEGQLFFQKHADPRTMPSLRQLDPAFDTDHDPLLEVDTLAGLIGSVQMNVIEFHTWNATTRAIEKPDRMTFDLDPGDGLGWLQMQEGAQLTRALLKELGLASFLKTSGGKGLHVVVPITPKFDWDTVKGLSQAVVQHLARTLPDRFVAKSGPKNRVGKIFADYLRNGRGATTAAAFSARSRPGMGVSIPVSWDELDSLTSGAQWTVRTADERLSLKVDPWADYKGTRQTLSKAMKLLDFKAPADQA
ncbi:DNA ligase D [soil metagenome]